MVQILSISRRPWVHLAGLFAAAVITACADRAVAQAPASDEDASARYLFYLHGAIIERQGPQAVSDRYGAYEYLAILDQFRKQGFEVISEARPPDTNVWAYAETVLSQATALLDDGVQASNITIVGASKGAVIAAVVSTKLRNANLRYVLMGNCNNWLIEKINPRLSGEILSIYEASDEIGSSCDSVVARSDASTIYNEIRLETGLGHGFLYRPIDAWVEPVVAWAQR